MRLDVQIKGVERSKSMERSSNINGVCRDECR